MSQSSRRRDRQGQRTPEQALNTNITPERHGKWTKIIISAVVIVLILVIAGISFYPTYVAPFRRTVITVDDTSIRMNYFLERIRLSGMDPLNMLNQLTREQVIKITAPQYGIKVGTEEIDDALRTMFQGQSANFTEAEFNEWYRQSLNTSGLSDAQYREIVATSLLTAKLQRYLAERVPSVATQRHLYIISTETYEQAQEVRAKWEAGEDFTALANEFSMDNSTEGGELGWFPDGGVLSPQLESEAFSLEVGDVSQPIAMMDQGASFMGNQEPEIFGYYIVWVAEEQAARELDADNLQAVRSNALDAWYSVERGNHQVKWHGLKNGFDSETYAWINWQLSKNQPSNQQK